MSISHLARVGLLAAFLAGGVATEINSASAAPSAPTAIGGKSCSSVKYGSKKSGKKCNKNKQGKHSKKGKSKGKPGGAHCGPKPNAKPKGVPEIDANLFGAGALLMIGGSLVLVGRRRESFDLA